MSTLMQARKAVAAQITAAGLSDVTVYDHEPAGVINGTAVTVSSAGIRATEWLLSVRVYVSDTVPDAAQDRLDEVAPAVDEVLGPAPRGDWQHSYDEDRSAYVSFVTVGYPREDF